MIYVLELETKPKHVEAADAWVYRDCAFVVVRQTGKYTVKIRK
jgi:hypothetical protein